MTIVAKKLRSANSEFSFFQCTLGSRFMLQNMQPVLNSSELNINLTKLLI